jgi:hypothetical protein
MNDDIIFNYRPISILKPRIYNQNYKNVNYIKKIDTIQLNLLCESLLNPFDLIDSNNFNLSHKDKQAPLILEFDNESFAIYTTLHQIINKYNINKIYFKEIPKYLNNLIKYNIEINNLSNTINKLLKNNESNLESIEDIIKINRQTIYVVDLKTITNISFFQNKTGSSLIIKIYPQKLDNYIINILDTILNMSNNSYIEIPQNHEPYFFLVVLNIYQNFHKLYINLENNKEDNQLIDTINVSGIFNDAIEMQNQLINSKLKYYNFEWTQQASQYVLVSNLNYCYSICKKYDLNINPAYLNQFGQIKEIVVNYSKYIDKYFPHENENNINRSQLQITNVGIYSITKPYVTKLIIDIIQKEANDYLNKELSELIITDGTGGVGGDALMFTKYFKYTNVVEIIKTHADIIANNLNVYERYNYKVINQNYLEIFDKLKQDIIYLDSPWGGIGYKEQKHTELYLFNSNLSFNSFVDILLKNKNMVFIKCPINYNIFQLSKIIEETKRRIKIKKVANFLLLVLF